MKEYLDTTLEAAKDLASAVAGSVKNSAYAAAVGATLFLAQPSFAEKPKADSRYAVSVPVIPDLLEATVIYTGDGSHIKGGVVIGVHRITYEELIQAYEEVYDLANTDSHEGVSHKEAKEFLDSMRKPQGLEVLARELIPFVKNGTKETMAYDVVIEKNGKESVVQGYHDTYTVSFLLGDEQLCFIYMDRADHGMKVQKNSEGEFVKANGKIDKMDVLAYADCSGKVDFGGSPITQLNLSIGSNNVWNGELYGHEVSDKNKDSTYWAAQHKMRLVMEKTLNIFSIKPEGNVKKNDGEK